MVTTSHTIPKPAANYLWIDNDMPPFPRLDVPETSYISSNLILVSFRLQMLRQYDSSEFAGRLCAVAVNWPKAEARNGQQAKPIV